GEVRFTQDLPFELRVGELVAFEIVLVEVLLHEFFAELEGVDRHLEIYGAGGGIDGGHALRAGGFDVFQRGAGEEAEANRAAGDHVLRGGREGNGEAGGEKGDAFHASGFW